MSETLKLWFFRDLTDDQRLKLFSLFGLPVAEIGNVHGRQEIALRHIAGKLVQLIPDSRPPIGDQEWCQPGDIRKRQFIVTFDDPDCRNAVFDDEIEARRFWAKACLNWNCYLFGALAVDPSPTPRAR